MKHARSSSSLLSLALALALGTPASGAHQASTANIVGTWEAKVAFDTSSWPAPKSDQEKHQREVSLAKAQKTVMRISFSPDHSFIATLSGEEAKTLKLVGHWTILDSTLIVKVTKSNGGPPSGDAARPQSMDIAEDGKSIVYVPPLGLGAYFKFLRVPKNKAS